jgi:hypothetical protein
MGVRVGFGPSCSCVMHWIWNQSKIMFTRMRAYIQFIISTNKFGIIFSKFLKFEPNWKSHLKKIWMGINFETEQNLNLNKNVWIHNFFWIQKMFKKIAHKKFAQKLIVQKNLWSKVSLLKDFCSKIVFAQRFLFKKSFCSKKFIFFVHKYKCLYFENIKNINQKRRNRKWIEKNKNHKPKETGQKQAKSQKQHKTTQKLLLPILLGSS